MLMLGQFTEDQKRLLAALPYRTGLWVSESDDSGGIEASEAERRALESIITGFTEDFCKSEFVEALMRETIARRDQWPSWRENIERVPAECRQAIDLLAERMEARDVTFFKHNLIEIAMTVALAYREYARFDTLSGKATLYMRYLRGRIRSFFAKTRPPTFEEILNISEEESLALQDLFEAIRPDDEMEGLPAGSASQAA